MNFLKLQFRISQFSIQNIIHFNITSPRLFYLLLIIIDSIIVYHYNIVVYLKQQLNQLN